MEPHNTSTLTVIRRQFIKTIINSKINNGKAPGADGIKADLVQAEKSLTFTILSKFFWEIWISKNMLEDWKTGLIVNILEEGDLLDSNNWRGLTLLSLRRKNSRKVILELFTLTLDKDIRKEKTGFRKGRSCSEHIFTLMQI